MRRMTQYILCGWLTLSLGACTQNELCYDHPHGKLIVETDWSELHDPGYRPEGVKISFYDVVTNTENASYRPAEGGSIAVNDGEYNLLVVNSDTEVIRFRNTKHFETAEAYVPYLDEEQQMIQVPDLHLVSSVSRHTLSHQAHRTSYTLKVTMQSLLKELSLEVKLQRSEKCLAARGVISGVAQAINLSTSQPTGASGTMQLTMTRDGDRYKIRTPILGFVTSGSTVTKSTGRIKQILRLEFLLVDGSVHVVETDVSSQIDNDSPDITFPISVDEIEIPDVEADGAFDTDIDNWGDEIIIPITT